MTTPTHSHRKNARARRRGNGWILVLVMGSVCVAILVTTWVLNVQYSSSIQQPRGGIDGGGGGAGGAKASLSFFEGGVPSSSTSTSRIRPPPLPPPSPSLDSSSGASLSSVPASSPYAYLFLIGGIDPNQPGYRGFLYNVFVSTEILRSHGSTADIWLFLQLHPNTNHTGLPSWEQRILDTLHIHTHWLEQPAVSSFSDITMEKFRILQLTQYKRVMFLDADLTPFTNMDYLMELSDPDSNRTRTMTADGVPLLQPNFVYATKGEPANAGCFVLEPRPGSYEEVLHIIRQQRESAKDLGYPFFSKIDGWGHNFFTHNDYWETADKQGKKWIWHAVHTDQGLLYYYVRYHVQQYTAFRGFHIDNFVPGPNGQPKLQRSLEPAEIQKHEPTQRVVEAKPCGENDFFCQVPPYSNFRHFVGKSKPWVYGYRPDTIHRKDQYAMRAFFNTLFAISPKLGLDITPENVNEKIQGDSPLGYMPQLWDFAKRQQGDSGGLNFTAVEETKKAAT